MSVITSLIEFKKPRQKMWGILKELQLIKLPYGNETDALGVLITGYATNCYADALEQAHDLLAGGTAMKDIQVVEFVPYNYLMTPTV